MCVQGIHQGLRKPLREFAEKKPKGAECPVSSGELALDLNGMCGKWIEGNDLSTFNCQNRMHGPSCTSNYSVQNSTIDQDHDHEYVDSGEGESDSDMSTEQPSIVVQLVIGIEL